MINLENCIKIGSGTVKYVYQHPYDEGAIIKIIKPELAGESGSFKNHGRFKGDLYQGIYRQFRREIIQYLQLCKNSYAENRFQFPIETPYGLIQTNFGLGLITEKIETSKGVSLTLEDLANKKLLVEKHFRALANFFDECVKLHVVFGEVNYAGLLYTETRSGKPEFVLVDGIGEKLLIPVRATFSSINARYIRKVQKRIQTQLDALALQK